MALHAERVKQDIERWLADGLIGRETAERLARDIEQREPARRFSLASIVALLAAVLVAAAVLVVVAANWEAVPRLARVGALFALILGGFVGGALLKQSRAPLFGDGLYLVGAAAFGAALALIGQMYHLSGDEIAAVLTWCVGVTLSAAALRSPVLTVAALLIAFAWFLMQVGLLFASRPFPSLYPALAVAIWAVSLWTGSRPTRHLILLTLIAYAASLGLARDFALWPFAAGAALSAALFLAAVLRPHQSEKMFRLGKGLAADALIGFWILFGMVQAEFSGGRAAVPLAAIALIGFVGALVLGGRRSRLVRWIAYSAFAGELAFLYVATVGTMFGTAALFLASGLALAVLASIIVRLERRMAGRAVEFAGAPT